MSEQENNKRTIASCIALIEQYKIPHLLSVAVTLAASIILLYLVIFTGLSVYWLVVLASLIVVGLLESIYAIRIGFDISLLKQLSQQSADINEGLAALDHALMKLHLISSNKQGRPLDERLRGCTKLFKTQVSLCIAQFIIMLIGIILGATTLQIVIN